MWSSTNGNVWCNLNNRQFNLPDACQLDYLLKAHTIVLSDIFYFLNKICNKEFEIIYVRKDTMFKT